MKNGVLYTIFLSLFLLWGYWYPYEWWLKYGLPEININRANASTDREEAQLNLPKTFWGSSLVKNDKKINKISSSAPTENLNADYSSFLLDEVKSCFGEGSIMQVSRTKGDIGLFFSTLQNELGPIQEDILLEKKATLTMKNGKSRTLVYEWISPEEGGDLYWHETDEEGFPRPIDLPENAEHDLVTFDQLKNLGSTDKVSETRLVQLSNNLQIGIEKSNEVIESFSIKDDGHLIKCRKDPAKNYVCDCLN